MAVSAAQAVRYAWSRVTPAGPDGPPDTGGRRFPKRRHLFCNPITPGGAEGCIWWSWSWLGVSFLWGLLIISFFAFLTPVPRRQTGGRLTPLEILQRRYASGELTTAEYEERKERLLQDRDLGERRAPPGPAAPQPQ